MTSTGGSHAINEDVHVMPHRNRKDYMKFVEHHRATNADITIGCLPVDKARASDFGLMKIDADGRITVSTRLPSSFA